MGVYFHEQKVIRIHPALDDDRVPLHFVEMVVFHEMLHQVFPPELDEDGRRIVHGPSFRAAERRFPGYERARAWEKAHLHLLLRQRSQPSKTCAGWGRGYFSTRLVPPRPRPGPAAQPARRPTSRSKAIRCSPPSVSRATSTSPAGELMDHIATAPTSGFFSKTARYYDADLFAIDLKRIVRWYNRRGSTTRRSSAWTSCATTPAA